MDTDIWRFQAACVSGTGPRVPFFAVEAIAAADDGQPNAFFCVYYQGTWYTYQAVPAWSAIGMAAAKYPSDPGWVVVVTSESGMTWELRPKERTERVAQLPGVRGITNLASIGDVIHACGMGRIVWRREADGSWTDLSAPHPSLNEGVVGFTSLAGADPSLIYAAGWKGEIWTFTPAGWEQEDTPSNANLNALSMASDGVVYAVGDDGVMLKGQRGRWDAVDTDVDFNLMDVCVHDGTVYACTDFEVLRLTDAGLVPDISDDAQDAPGTCLRLVSAGADGLYSVGPYDVFVLLDGAWGRVA